MKNYRKKYLLSAIGVLGVLAPLAAISCSPKHTAAKTITFFKSTDNSDYDQLLYTKAKAEAVRLGYTMNVVSSVNSVSTELTNVQKVITAHLSKAVVFQPVNTSNSINALKKLLDANIKVVVPDRTFADSDILKLTTKELKNLVMQVTSNNKKIAEDAAKAMYDFWINKKLFTAKTIKDQRIIILEGETASSSSKERIDGFKEYMNKKGIKNKNMTVLTANWSETEAQTKFTAQVNGNIKKAGIGLFAANDQMAKGVLTSSAMKIIGKMAYPIATVDAHKWSKDYISNQATTGQKREIVNYAQRTDTEMKWSTDALIYSIDHHALKSLILKGVIMKDVTYTLKPDAIYTKTLGLPGVPITMGKYGKIINQSSFV